MCSSLSVVFFAQTPDFCFHLPGTEHSLTDLESHRPLETRLDLQKCILQRHAASLYRGWIASHTELPLLRMLQNEKNQGFIHIYPEIRIKSIKIFWQNWISFTHYNVIYVTKVPFSFLCIYSAWDFSDTVGSEGWYFQQLWNIWGHAFIFPCPSFSSLILIFLLHIC